jgi:hypothetical protein
MAFKMLFHDTQVALGMAGVVGTLALLGVCAVSSEAQKTLRLWIKHRAELMVARTERFKIRRLIKAAICGERWTKSGADEIRKAAAAYQRTDISLTEIMRITRGEQTIDASEEDNSFRHGSPAAGDDVTRGPLAIVPQHESIDDQANPG